MTKNIQPVQIIRPNQVLCPAILSLPHAGNFLPPEFVEMSALSVKQLHLSEDTFTDSLFWSDNFNFPMIKANYSRSYIDVNREPFELTKKMFKEDLPIFINHYSQKAAKGYGTIPEKIRAGMKIYKHKLSFDEVRKRVEEVYKPFHNNLTLLIKEAQKNFGKCFLLDCHSMPFRKGRKNFDIVISNNFGTSCLYDYSQILQGLCKEQGFSVTFNKPFSGGYTVCHYGCPELGICAVQIEVLRNLYMDEEALKKANSFNEIQSKLQYIIKQFTSMLQTK